MIKNFLKYVEIMTKITSTFAFLVTVAYLFYLGQDINWKLSLLFFAAMFLFDLTTTAINNYIDTKTNHQILSLERGAALLIIYLLLGISIALGLWLVYLTDIIVLLLGGLCFICGILYTYGPLPISRQPWGELLSGIFYGLLIPMILLYINMPAGTYFSLDLSLKTISLELQILPLITVVLFSVAPVFTTADIMLANNICDLEHDIRVSRYTLPYYLGVKRSLYLFATLYYGIYVAVVIMTAFQMLSPLCLIFLLTILPVQKNIRTFFREQDKAVTFVTSIKNYIIIMGTLTLLIFFSGFIS